MPAYQPKFENVAPFTPLGDITGSLKSTYSTCAADGRANPHNSMAATIAKS